MAVDGRHRGIGPVYHSTEAQRLRHEHKAGGWRQGSPGSPSRREEKWHRGSRGVEPHTPLPRHQAASPDTTPIRGEHDQPAPFLCNTKKAHVWPAAPAGRKPRGGLPGAPRCGPGCRLPRPRPSDGPTTAALPSGRPRGRPPCSPRSSPRPLPRPPPPPSRHQPTRVARRGRHVAEGWEKESMKKMS